MTANQAKIEDRIGFVLANDLWLCNQTRIKLGNMPHKMQKCFSIALAVSAVLNFVLVGSTAKSESFGIKFLGNTTDSVTNAAGMVPISGWNNIANTNFTSGTIHSSDGRFRPRSP